jgi:hypothetical protein
MKKPLLIVLVLAALAVTTWLSLTYFEVQKLFIDERVDEALPAETTTSTDTAPRAPQKIAEGNLVRVDSIHYGEGIVQLLQTSTDEQIVRFDNVTIGNGPDLYVYVSDSTEPTNKLESLGNYANLGKLKGNIGSQNYTLPSSEELGFEPRTVIVWCKRFEVLFTYAVLK